MKKAKTRRNTAVVCPHCGIETKVPGNGLYHCCNCGYIFSVDLEPAAPIRKNDFSGVTIADWIVDDMGLYPCDGKRLAAKLNVRKPLPFGGNIDGVTPFAMASTLKERGANVKLVGVRAWGSPKNLPDFDEDERLVILLGGKESRWIAVRKFEGKLKFIDPAGKAITEKIVLEDKHFQMMFRVGRRFHTCPLRMA